MLVTLGARPKTDDLVDLLAACHRRIRHHVVLARRLVEQGADRPLEEVRETAAQICRYFTVAFPLHLEDEDQTIAPRLIAAGEEVAAALEAMEKEHLDHQPLVDRFVALCREIERHPAQLAATRDALSRATEHLATELATHLELEERVVFPALRAMPTEERARMLGELRERRKDGAGDIPVATP